MKILKERSGYLEAKRGGNGLWGTLIRLFSRKARNHDQGLKGEEAVIKTLQTLDDSYLLINDLFLPGGGGNIDHLLLAPKGIFVIETKNWKGEIACNGDRWSRRFPGLFSSKVFNLESPSKQVKRSVKRLKAILMPHYGQVEVDGLVVFTNPNSEICLSEATVPVLKVEELGGYFSRFGSTMKLSPRDLEALGQLVLDLDSKKRAEQREK